MTSSRFTVINDGFDCEFCGAKVEPSEKSCRNHCPVCLSSKHVDQFPGDRQNSCLGQMKPFSYEMTRKGIVLHFRCLRCGEEKKNISAYGSNLQPDDFSEILKIFPK